MPKGAECSDVPNFIAVPAEKVQADMQGGKAEGAEDDQRCKARAAQEFFHKLLLQGHQARMMESSWFTLGMALSPGHSVSFPLAAL